MSSTAGERGGERDPQVSWAPALATAPAGSRSPRSRLIFGAVLTVYFLLLVFVDGYWDCYPSDNDLDEVGWLSSHLDIHRPESFANQGYPPGLPVLLRVIGPLCGSVLRGAFIWQAIVTAVSVIFLYRIARALLRHESSSWVAAACAALAVLPLGTAEFADGTCTCLVVIAVWFLVTRAPHRGALIAGLLIGLAYLFRTHYMVMLALLPVAMILIGGDVRVTARGIVAFWAGFAMTAWPLWLLNVLAYGTPLHAGVSQYNISNSMFPGVLDWQAYPGTYNLWPLSRILHERRLEFVKHFGSVTWRILRMHISAGALILATIAFVWTRDNRLKRWLGFFVALAMLYVLIVISPTRFTERSFGPVAMIACLLLAAGYETLVTRWSPRRATMVGLAVGIVALAYPPGIRSELKHRHGELVYNRQLVGILLAAGMQSSSEVFSNEWNVYDLADPRFDTFYNYGGWILLDSRYAHDRPPPQAHTVQQWQNFFADHQIKFAILRRRPETEELFRQPPAAWRLLFSDARLTVWAL